jgi:hypothetical protein
MKTHRLLVPALLVSATLLAFVGAFAVWVNRQALNTENWATTSQKLLANKQIQTTLSAYLVNELFTSVDVAQALEQKLPPQAQPLAGPAAAGLRQLADRAAPKLLARPRVQDAWVAANTAAHKTLLKVIDGGGPALSTTGGEVKLNVHALVTDLANNLGIGSQVAAAQTKLQGSGGDQARALAQQKLGVVIPASSGEIVIMKSDQLGTAQDVAGAIKGAAIVLPALAIALFALAVYLARGRRRRTLRTTGWCFVAAGVLLLLIRRIGGNEIVDALVKVPSNKPAIHEVWTIATSLLYAIAVAMVAYGLVMVASAWFAGSTRLARLLREASAPTLRDRAALSYGIVGGVLFLVVVWGPTPAFRNPATILIFAGLLALGVAMLRREAGREFPDAQAGFFMRELDARRSAARSPQPAVAGSGNGMTDRLAEIERLVALHDKGDLTDAEFAAEKTHLVGSG